MHRIREAAAVAALSMVTLAPASSPAQAPPPRPSSATANATTPSPLPGCSLRGSIPMGKGVEIFDAQSGGAAIARFTGASTPLWIAQLPADPKLGRAKVATSVGQGVATVRIEGWVQASTVPLFVTRDVASVPGHVWIARGHRVELVRVAADGLEVRLAVAGTSGQSVTAKVPCDALALSPTGAPQPSIPGGARHWVTRGGAVDLFDKAGGSVVFTLQLGGGAVQSFWGSETRGPFLRVDARSDVVLSGWVRLADVSSVKEGEIRARHVPPQAPAGSQVQLPDNPPLARVLRETTVHVEADRNARVIGAVEPNAEVYVLSTITGYVSVLPRGVGVMAPERKGFWILASQIAR
jgi:hypothetical protein